ncbi:peptidase [Peterkaempfera bronchialis]|uniref:Peptidase n=1 Tax=Peterkaempfera bronchialis TaxID=2126346 RepID=A0A345SZH1_9ACTN|nr:peptidase [Peterkaempfera bronchialis]AXI79126.1 peptidase [Peterkaempfera bronchialis]
MRTAHLLYATATTALLLAASAAPAAADTASPSPSGSAETVTRAGTSFLTATTVQPGQQVQLSASTGDYLYWSFASAAGQTDSVAVTVTLPPTANRHGAATWTVDVFDGLRRRQACTAGAQTATAEAEAESVSLDCTLRQVRSWAEPWSGDPLPGTYYVRLSVTDLPETDLGLPIQAEMRIASKGGDADPEGGDLKAPLVPAVNAGATLAPGDAVPSPGPSSSVSAAGAGSDDDGKGGWFSGLTSRWFWTAGGGVLAALLGVAGYSLTRHRHGWFSARP